MPTELHAAASAFSTDFLDPNVLRVLHQVSRLIKLERSLADTAWLSNFVVQALFWNMIWYFNVLHDPLDSAFLVG